MNYFTSERVVGLQHRSDEQGFLAALDDWERAVQGYKARLLQVRAQLPNDMRQLIDTVALHDARVLDMWWGGRSQFTITLHPESEPSRLVVLIYSLIEPPAVVQDVLPICERIAREIRNQYTLAFISTNTKHDGTYRPVQVRVQSPKGASVMTRPGYVAPLAESGNAAPQSKERN